MSDWSRSTPRRDGDAGRRGRCRAVEASFRRSCRRRLLRLGVLLLVVAGALAPTMLTLAAPSAAAEPARVDVVAVMPVARGGTAAVMQLRPAPTVTLPDDAVTVSAAGTTVRAVTRPLLSDRSPLALVLDASQAGAPALPQSLSGAAALLLRQQAGAPVVVVADRSPPQLLTPRVTTPPAALSALSDLRPGGSRSTSEALALAELRLPHLADAPSLVVLSTSGAAPAAPGAGQIADRLRASQTVLSVVETSKEAESWSSVATATGGLAVRSTAEGAGDAFDEVSSALRARYVVTFTPPAGAESVDLRVLSAGRTLTAQVPVSGRIGPSADGSTPAGSSTGLGNSHPSPLRWVVLAALAVAGVALALLLRARRGRPGDGGGHSYGVGEVDVASRLSPSGRVRVVDASDAGARTETGQGSARPRTVANAATTPEERTAPRTTEDGGTSVPATQKADTATMTRALPFRQEALAARADRLPSGAPLQFARWPRWLYVALLGLLMSGLAFGLTARTSRTVSGPAVVDVQRGVFTAALPQSAAAVAPLGRTVELDLPGAAAPGYEGRITSTTVADLARQRQSALRGMPGADPGSVLVTGHLVPLYPSTARAVSKDQELRGRATIILGSDRLLAVILGGFADLLGGG